MQVQLDNLTQLEERVQRAVELIRSLRTETQRLQEETQRLHAEHETLERRAAALAEEKDELLRESERLRGKEQEWVQYERDREEIRARIDGMLARFEELEI